MIETHPFDVFTPVNTNYLILGSFSGQQAVKGTAYTYEAYDWYYGTKTNQFWPIMEKVYGVQLKSKENKQGLLTRLSIGIADIIYACERKHGNNLDANLINIQYNDKAIQPIFYNHKIEKVFFTSRFVEKKFKKVFKDTIRAFPSTQFITLPSPSPRYARISFEEKVQWYREILPDL